MHQEGAHLQVAQGGGWQPGGNLPGAQACLSTTPRRWLFVLRARQGSAVCGPAGSRSAQVLCCNCARSSLSALPLAAGNDEPPLRGEASSKHVEEQKGRRRGGGTRYGKRRRQQVAGDLCSIG